MNQSPDAGMSWANLCKEIESRTLPLKTANPKIKPTVLICALDPESTNQAELLSADWGIEIVRAHSGAEALQRLRQDHSRILLVICPAELGDMSALAFRSEFTKALEVVPLLILADSQRAELLSKIEPLSQVGLLEKPFDRGALASVLSGELIKRIASIYEDLELLCAFIEETKGCFEQIESLALELEQNPTKKELLNSLFGIVHTIKGASSFFQPQTLHRFYHRFEDVLKRVQGNTLKISQPFISATLKVVDISRGLLKEFDTQIQQEHNLEDLCQVFSDAVILGGGNIEPPSDTQEAAQEADSSANASTAHPVKENSIKIDIQLLDQLLRASGEMTVVRNMVNKSVLTLEKRYSSDKDVTQLGDLLDELHKVNAMVQGKITEVRKVSLKNVFKTLPRLVRDVTEKTKKSCSLRIEGEDLLVDSSISEVLNASMSHLLRNSIDHGIETPEERVRLGKSEKGMLLVRAFLKNDHVMVEVRDDGKGIDVEAIRKKIVSKGMRTEAAAALMPDAEVYGFIFESGFSTAAQTTEISGRGVGTSAVKTSVEGIGGRIRIETEKSKGTCFVLELPIPKSVHIKNCLFVMAGGQEFGVAQDQIVRLIQIDEQVRKQLICELEGGILLRESEAESVPLVSLGAVLFSSQLSVLPSQFTVVVVKAEGGKNFGLIVDEIRDFEDAVVRELAPSLKKLDAYSGATFLSDGTIGLLLSVDGIAKIAHIRTELFKSKEKKLQTQLQNGSTQSADWLLFELSIPGVFAIPRNSVFRLEEFDADSIQKSGNFNVIPYRKQILPILNMSELLGSAMEVNASTGSRIQVIVMASHQRYLAFKVKQIIDIASSNGNLEPPIADQRGIQGNLVLGGRTITVIDPEELVAA